jgi:hypothetical protein
MGYPGQPSEKAAVVATIDPQAIAAGGGTVSSDWVDMRKFGEALFVLLSGAIDGPLNAKLQEAKDGSGTGVQDLTGKAMAAWAATDDNKQAVFNLKAEELSLNAGYTHARLSVTSGGGASTHTVAAVGLGLCPRFGPASDDDSADVKEIVT